MIMKRRLSMDKRRRSRAKLVLKGAVCSRSTWPPSKTSQKSIARQKIEATPGNYRGLHLPKGWLSITTYYCNVLDGDHMEC